MPTNLSAKPTERRVREIALLGVLVAIASLLAACRSTPPTIRTEPWSGLLEETLADGSKRLRMPPFSGACSVRLNPAALPQKPSIATFRDVAKHLEAALIGAGYSPLQYYRIEGGFAIVTSMESVDDQGRPLARAARWKVENDILSIRQWLRALTSGNHQTCRVISIAVTNRAVSLDNTYLPLRDLQPWRRDGVMAIPNDQADQVFTDAHQIYALVYMFKIEEKRGKNGEIERNGMQIPLEPNSPEIHLKNSGIAGRL